MITRLIPYRQFDRNDPFANIFRPDAEGVLVNIVQTSLFSDARIGDQEKPKGVEDPRGWWADTYIEEPGRDSLGSLLWIHDRSIITAATLKDIDDKGNKGLAWMVTEGLAKKVTLAVVGDNRENAYILVEIVKNDGNVIKIQFERLWEGLT